MSSSTSNRTVQFTAEERAKLACQLELDRCKGRLMPALNRRALELVRHATQSGRLGVEASARLERRIDAAEMPGELRSLMEGMPNRSPKAEPRLQGGPVAGLFEEDDPRGVFERHGAGGSLRSAATRQPLDRTRPALTLDGIDWGIVEVRTRLDVVVEDAHSLGMEPTSAAGLVRAQLDRAQTCAARGDAKGADAHLRRASDEVDALTVEVDEVLVQREERRATLQELLAGLHQMGFKATIEYSGGEQVLTGLAADGRTMVIRSSLDGDGEIEFRATDMAHAVPLEASEAGELCLSAVETNLRVHLFIDGNPLLVGGDVSIPHPPTRGHPAAAKGQSQAARSRQAGAATNHQTRRTT